MGIPSSTINVVRGAVSACARDAFGKAQPTHIHRLLRLCQRYELDGDILQEALEALHLCGELQDLGGGYQIPAPSRIVALAQGNLVLSIEPTTHLAEHFRITESGGYGRFSDAGASPFPVQTLESWLACPADTPAWTRKKLEALESNLYLDPDAFMGNYWGPDESGAFWGWRGRSIPIDLPTAPGWYLCRRSSPRVYTLCKQSSPNESQFVECSPIDAGRLRFGLASLSSTPIRARVDIDLGLLLIYASARLPREESRFLATVGDHQSSNRGTQYSVDVRATAELMRLLANLSILMV